MENLSVEELEKKLIGYKTAYEKIEAGLRIQSSNEALLKAKNEILNVIDLTEKVLRLKRKPHANTEITTDEKPKIIPLPTEVKTEPKPVPKKEVKQEIQLPTPNPAPSIVETNLVVGGLCMALWEDGQYYQATIESISTDGYFVTFAGYGNQALVGAEAIQPIQQAPQPQVSTTPSNQQTKQPTLPGEREKKKIEVDESGEVIIPKSLKFLPTDTEDIRNMKKRKIHAIKSQYRQQQLDQEREQSSKSWLNFSKKGKVSSIPSSLAKRDSMFKTPEETPQPTKTVDVKTFTTAHMAVNKKKMTLPPPQ
jgi:survival-of-motor-neuron-related-splicing factor 30